MTSVDDTGRHRDVERSAYIETDEAEASETAGLRWDLTAAENRMLGDLIVSSLRNFRRVRKSDADEAESSGA